MEAKQVSGQVPAATMRRTPPPAPGGFKKFWSSQERIIVGSLAILAFLAFWETIVTYMKVIDPLFASAPSLILTAGLDMVATGEIFRHSQVTLVNLLVGFILAAIVGNFAGIAMGRMKYFDYAGTPFVDALNSVPRIAFLPLIIIWFGIGMWSKVVLVFLGAIFPMLINAYEGVRGTDPKLIEAAKAYGATEKDIFFKVVFPASIPFIVAGLRQGMGRALISVVVAEFFASNAGLGYLIQFSGATFRTGHLFVAILVVAVFGILATYGIRVGEKRIAPWLHERHAE